MSVTLRILMQSGLFSGIDAWNVLEKLFQEHPHKNLPTMT